MIKGVYEKPTTNIIFHGKTEIFPPKVSGKDKNVCFPNVLVHCTGSSSQSIRWETEIKAIQIEKEEGKLPLFSEL